MEDEMKKMYKKGIATRIHKYELMKLEHILREKKAISSILEYKEKMDDETFAEYTNLYIQLKNEQALLVDKIRQIEKKLGIGEEQEDYTERE